MVLENELTYQNVTMNPEAAQLLESRSFSIEEICRWFRVPPFMVGHTTKQSSWASSLEGMNMLFLTHTLRPLLVNIEQEISRCLLNSDEDLFAEFSVEGLLRADSAGRAAYYTSALQNGWMSRNDVRRLENMPPIEGGDIYTVQLNLTQLKNLESSNPAVQALALRELHNHVFPDISFEQSPLKRPLRSTFLMSKKQLPVAPAGRPCARVTCETLPSALDRWDGGIKAAATDDNSISVFDVIGQDYWGEGITAKRIAGALRAMNGADVTVNINSPGGDMFEGLAIYNLLREYEGRVTVKVLGIAASAASIIAMAGDDIQIGRGAFLMIHNCWVYAMGNRLDFAELALSLEPFDTAMADIYAARSGLDIAAFRN
ncbi:phage portal protein [Klebsiella pneumoniae]|nr:phage portal protein [Klebsiella pneumoniae]